MGSTKSCLLAMDNNDYAYIGDVNRNNNIDKIYYGTLGGTWKSITLNTPVSKTHLLVSASGQIYENDNVKRILIEIQTGKETTYKGTLLQLYSGGIASLSEGNLVITPFD